MEKWEEAYKDYLSGMKTKDIAEKYGVTVSAVKSWKSRKWTYMQAEKDIEVAQKDADAGTQMKKQGLQPGSEKRQAEKKKRGAPKGNQNAVGNHGGPPKGSKNNYKHGIYEKILFETLSEEEQELYRDRQFDEIEELRIMVRLCDLRILKFEKKINELEMNGKSLILNGSKAEFKQDGNGRPRIESTQTTHIAVYQLILQYNEQIERISNKKVRCLETLIKMGFDDQKLELEKARLKMNSGENTPNMNVQIFIPENNRK